MAGIAPLVDEIQPMSSSLGGPALKFAGPVVRWLGRLSLVVSDIVNGAPPRWAERWMLQQATAIVVSTNQSEHAWSRGVARTVKIHSVRRATSTVDRVALC